MGKTYLFDWGNTLMVDFPESRGKMYQWGTVKCVEGAKATLRHLAHSHKIYIATSAMDSCEADIKKAFDRVGLSCFINGYFCYANTGLHKTSADFYYSIIKQLKAETSSLTMVGDTFAKDILPALASGINAAWYNPQHASQPPLELPLADKQSFKIIHQLKELLK
ncbi:HAD family hydrolase [Paraglaciecola sp. L1A13]|uniref:HAD family hydrolase n=1 Tax=Paraglaciecola sp. L1A13 TaxID=2686359 RepID=UPI001E3457BC|nr:HAD family hydrolase [Paraglaciecola sp. L1A13]